MVRSVAPLLALLAAACSPAAPPPGEGTVTAPPPSPSPADDRPPHPAPVPTDPPVVAPPPGSPAPSIESLRRGPRPPPIESRRGPRPPPISAADAASVVYPEGVPPAAQTACPASLANDERIRCLVRGLFDGSPEAAMLAVGAYDRGGHVIGVERPWVMDGGFRGTIQIVPELPIGRHQRHLDWVVSAMDEIDEFFSMLRPRAPHEYAYRWRALSFRFLRSVGRTTPSAYAQGWTVAYNVMGSLHRSADKVRETLFHELFHLNDEAHGDWTRANLSGPFQQIVGRCGTNRACLQPWAPSETTVRGGTYYAFQPDNGEAYHEYGAELALRWYREQRAVLRGGHERPFKCGPEPNARVWALLSEEFFGGADVTPACP